MSKKNKFYIYLFFIFTLLVGLLFGENSSGGAKFDYNYLFPFIEIISLNLKEGLVAFLTDTGSLIHSPVFSILIAPFYKFFGNILYLKLFYLLLSSAIPYIFYLILKLKYKINNKIIFILSLIIFLSPYFRSSAIWLLGDNLSILFFGLSILFYNKTLKSDKIIKNYYLTLIFLIFCCYIRYYYCIFALFYLFRFYKKLLFKDFLLIILFSFILSLPALLYFYHIFENYEFFNKVSSYGNLNYYRNSLIISSILLFYLIPFAILDIKEIIKYISEKKKILFIIILIMSFAWLVDFLYIKSFENFPTKGGGVFVKIAQLMRFNESIFLSFLTFVFFLILDFYFKNNKLINYSIILILFLSFPIYTIYQKYLDPLFFFVFFGLVSFENNRLIIDNIKKIIFILSYYSSFYIFSLIYYGLN